MSHSTTTAKFAKPSDDFPLFPHASGRWAKKIRGKFHYFGKCADDPKGEAALQQWLDEKDDLLGGRAPRARAGAVAVRDVCNDFLNFKRRQKEAGDIVAWTFSEYEATCTRIIKVFGAATPVEALRPEDFGRLRVNIAKQWGPTRQGNEIQRVRCVFKYGVDSELLGRLPRFGTEFKKPSAKKLRLARAERGKRMFEPAEVQAVLAAACPNLKAMVLLAINAGLGNHDVACLPTKALDLERGWINYPRPKTGINRRVPLWAETVEALKAALKARPSPQNPEHSGLVFITREGCSYQGDQVKHPVVDKFSNLLRKIKLKRPGLSFYAIRHTFQTIGEGARDLSAVQTIMGHAAASNDMSARYREGVDDQRLQAVTDHVRKWLWPSAT
jgi:integrase